VLADNCCCAGAQSEEARSEQLSARVRALEAALAVVLTRAGSDPTAPQLLRDGGGGSGGSSGCGMLSDVQLEVRHTFEPVWFT
jgi:hypothetical protein